MAATQELELAFPTMRYDMMLPLFEGRVEIPGVKLRPYAGVVMLYKDEPTVREGDFGLADLNLGYFLAAVEAGWELIGLPVFSKRKMPYHFIFCRADAGISSPQDLEGKRIGSRGYRTALTIWNRGLLQHRFGVDLSTMRWIVGTPDVFAVYGEKTSIEQGLDLKKTAADWLLDGDVDAIITDISDGKLFEILEKDPRVKRLFPDYMEEDRRLYRETGNFTPVHMIVMSRKLDRQHPDLAGRLYEAFEKSKQVATNDILADQRGFGVVYLRERKLEEMKEWGDPWKHGITANKNTIDTFIQYNQEQGMIRLAPSYEQIFAASTLDT